MSRKANAGAIRTIGIDTGKNTFHLIGLGEQGTIVSCEKLARGRVGSRLANVSPCLFIAGCRSHHCAIHADELRGRSSGSRRVWRPTMLPASCSRWVMM
jgi:hypothetical protein